MTYTPPNSIRTANGTLLLMSERTFNDVCEGAQLWWDSESRKSPFSTVCDPEDEFCEDCEAAAAEHCDECAAYLAKQAS
jgi:hypothetical protein